MLREGNRNWELSPPGPRQGLPSGTRSPGGSHMLRQVTRGQRSLTDSHITAVAEAETTKTRQSSFDVSAPGDAGSSPPHRLGFCTGRPRPRRWQAAFPHHRSLGRGRREQGRGVGQSGRPPPPAGLLAGAVTSRRLKVPGAEAREGAGAEPVLYKRSPPSARSCSPRPRAPRLARPRPPARARDPGAAGRRGTEHQAAGGRRDTRQAAAGHEAGARCRCRCSRSGPC